MKQLFFYINYISLLINDLYNYICPYSNVILINKSTFKIIHLYFIYNILYLAIIFLSKFLFFLNLENHINSFFINYHIIYNSNSKIHLSNNFIINEEVTRDYKEVNSDLIESILFQFNNFDKVDVTNKIKKYSKRFTLFLFCLLNNINPSDIDKIIVNTFNETFIEKKILTASNYLNKEIEKLSIKN